MNGPHSGSCKQNFEEYDHLTRSPFMTDSVYKVIELVGTSGKSWEDAARNAVETAGKTLKNLRIAEISKLDMKVEDGKVTAYRAKVSLSFKYES
jgi:hypothetical protein